ncbi:head maturation protease, ClpP-related [Paracoccus sp. SSK6]|uniref:head maturation protease, ClpP-related n=1 Tax=Paracoccus sp. SSK6 TaxID=3143131 RepID=UPI00321A94BD
MARQTPDSVALYHTFVTRSSGGEAAVMNADGQKAKIRLFGVISPWENTAATFMAGLDQLAADGVKEADLEINSPGGSVSEALAIHDAIKASGITFRAVILGIAASAATVVSAACSDRVIGKNARFMIHEAESGAWGRSSDMREVADWLDEINEQTAIIYSEISGQSVVKVKEWMKEEKWWRGQEAVNDGFASGVLEVDAAPALAEPEMRAYQNAPADLIEAVQSAAETPDAVVEIPAEQAPVADAEMAAPEAPAAFVETPAVEAPEAPAVSDAQMQAEADPVIAALKSGADEVPVMTARPAEAAQQTTAKAPAPWVQRIAEMNRNFGRF